MFVKPVVVVMMVLASTAACAGSPNERDEDVNGDEASSTDSSSLALRQMTPGPLDYPVPSLPSIDKTILWSDDFGDWDVPRLGQGARHLPQPMCEVHWIPLNDPVKGKTIEIAVTVCP
jgi:hypothetical protein